jgi:pyrimidine operon attenuation protein/uracil phosphoribosyltransferase
MTKAQNKIKSADDVKRIIHRIAYQIYENNINETTLVVAGISSGGNRMAQLLEEALSEISDLKVKHVTLIMDKKNPRNTIESSIHLEDLINESIIIVDDVLNTGKTLIYAVNYFLRIPVSKINTAVMVNRNHKNFPIKADFKGISLSTSINEHVSVILDGENRGVYLS